MSKNNKLINSLKQVAARNREMNIYAAACDVTPHVYASVAIALHRYYGWGYKRINDLFIKCQEVCNEDTREGLLETCERETGICIEKEWKGGE